MRFPNHLLGLLLVGAGLLTSPPGARAGDGGLGDPLSVEECWKTLPTATVGGGQRLAEWALLTARDLPRTTAAMLELDRLHRTRNPIGPVLRGAMRWVAADANRCEY